MIRRLLPLLLLLAAAPPTSAGPLLRSEPPPGGVPDPGLESLAWLAGRWTGEGLGGEVEDLWAPPRGGQIVGLFRSLRGGEVRFYELITLLHVEGRLTMRLKHFTAALHGWEEKDETVDFPLVDHEEGVWYFDGLTLARRGEDGMDVHVLVGDDGKEQVASFSYTRAAP